MDTMTKRHEASVLNAIDELCTHGFAVLSKELLVKRWYKQDRMSKTVWRDVKAKLPEDWSEKDVLVFEWGNTIILLEKDCTDDLATLI